ncbi:MAG: methylated-DNA--[protein]-cysteine S-methyltransferase [Ignavibacteria bacterium]|nr:methylated-DNA--[protein]-cysteine S-methyltransferase [Ignavibacteria bacterium]
MVEEFKTFYQSPIGVIEIVANQKGITRIDFVNNKSKRKSDEPSNEILDECVKQLDEYFKGQRKTFNLNLNLIGTEFQKRVWQELLKIPFGKTLSYRDVANRIKNPKAVRAVGQAIGKNPISIVVPCHRVIGSDGSLTGYASGLKRKEWLLKHEGIL